MGDDSSSKRCMQAIAQKLTYLPCNPPPYTTWRPLFLAAGGGLTCSAGLLCNTFVCGGEEGHRRQHNRLGGGGGGAAAGQASEQGRGRGRGGGGGAEGGKGTGGVGLTGAEGQREGARVQQNPTHSAALLSQQPRHCAKAGGSGRGRRPDGSNCKALQVLQLCYGSQ